MGTIQKIALLLLAFAVSPLLAKDNSIATGETNMPCQRLLQNESVDGPTRQTRSQRVYFDVDSRDSYYGGGAISDDFSQEPDAIDPGDF